MVWYDYKMCVRCGQDFYAVMEFWDEVNDRQLCDTCESINPDPNARVQPYQWVQWSPENIIPAAEWASISHRDDLLFKSMGDSHFASSANGNNARAQMRGVEGVLTGPELWRLYVQQSGQCAYCGTLLLQDWHADHIIPLSGRGNNTASNIALACKSCNISKQDRTPKQWRMAQVRHKSRL